jgi:lipopolysaccharide transport system permease protein
MNARHSVSLLRELTLRDLRQRFAGSLLGVAWLVLQPLAMVAIYALVFVEILRVRLPALDPSQVAPFLIAGLWPWTAYSESISRATGSIAEHAGLLAKVAVPRAVLPAVPVVSAAILHGGGFVAALLTLKLMGYTLDPVGIPAALAALMLLLALAQGVAWALAAINVFVRDLGQLLPQVLTLWFFLTPIFFQVEMIPERIRPWIAVNPVVAYVETIRHSLIGSGDSHWLAMFATSAIALLVGGLLFRRLAPHFEDFL